MPISQPDPSLHLLWPQTQANSLPVLFVLFPQGYTLPAFSSRANMSSVIVSIISQLPQKISPPQSKYPNSHPLRATSELYLSPSSRPWH